MSESTPKKTIRQLVINYITELCNNSKITDIETANEAFQKGLNCKRSPFRDKKKGNYIQPIHLSNGQTIWLDIQQWSNTKTKEILINMANQLGVDPADYGIDSNNDSQVGSSTANEVQITATTNLTAQNDNDKKREVLQVIYYGAPGTGKSWTINNLLEKEITYRTTFHPDTDYATFIGCYKPSMDNNNIVYRFSPQIFLIAYLRAWYEYNEWLKSQQSQKSNHSENNDSNPENENNLSEQKPNRVYLVIEEINRGNCAQIFGDIFQLLDRDDEGFSSYPIIPDQDIVKFINDRCGTTRDFFDRYKEVILKITEKQDVLAEIPSLDNKVFDGLFSETDQIKLAFPPNFHIWATMNTSDQSLYPMDSAFKRRWEWKHVKINTKHDKIKDITLFNDQRFKWPGVIDKINEKIKSMLHSADKQIGEFFIKSKDGKTIDFVSFRDKVLFYLFNDVFKENKKFGDDFFGNDGKNYLYEDLLSMELAEQIDKVNKWLLMSLGLSDGNNPSQQSEPNGDSSFVSDESENEETTES